jgi:hypothetical protein
MKTKTQIINYLKEHYPKWDPESYDFYAQIISDLCTNLQSELVHAYIDLGKLARIQEVDNNLSLLVFNPIAPYKDLTEYQELQNTTLMPYWGEDFIWANLTAQDALLYSLIQFAY